VVWLNERFVRCRIDGKRLFDQAEEQFAACLGFAAVESKCELI